MTKSYEANRNLLTQIQNKTNGVVVSQYGYGNDSLGRRTNRIDTLASYGAPLTNAFGYNTRSELIDAVMNTNTFGYVFDNIGNRETSTNNSEVLTYLANSLNQYTNIADGVTNALVYDLDGNLTNDGVRAYSWNNENRLTGVEPVSPSSGDKKLALGYDYMGRRFKKVVSEYTNSAWTAVATNYFIYDGWNLISERSAGFQPVTNSYVWGLDLSGSLQGAGGIGGLLVAEIGGTDYLYTYDANGNVGQLVDASDGSLKAEYEYGPFGGIVKQTGTAASSNPFRFSTKYFDDETALSYYGYRYYQPETGRWVSRDPIEEEGANLYRSMDNDAVGLVDLYGLEVIREVCEGKVDWMNWKRWADPRTSLIGRKVRCQCYAKREGTQNCTTTYSKDCCITLTYKTKDKTVSVPVDVGECLYTPSGGKVCLTDVETETIKAYMAAFAAKMGLDSSSIYATRGCEKTWAKPVPPQCVKLFEKPDSSPSVDTKAECIAECTAWTPTLGNFTVDCVDITGDPVP